MDVLQFIAQEYTTADIANKLFLSYRTIEDYRKSLLLKWGLKILLG
jgi:DNA-binding NarL/FixJ family response regulator